MMITTILFDLDDTLYSRNDYIKKTYNYIIKQLNLPKEISKYMYKEYLKNGENQLFQKTIKKYNIEEQYVKNMLQLYHNSKINISLYDDVKNFINLNKKYKLGIITNGGTETQNNKIKLLKLNKYFEQITITGELFERKDWKPSCKPFNYTTNKMNVLNCECIYVGDKIDIDIYGAINSNILPVLIDRNQLSSIIKKKINNNNYYVINSIGQLNNLINKLEGRKNDYYTNS